MSRSSSSRTSIAALTERARAAAASIDFLDEVVDGAELSQRNGRCLEALSHAGLLDLGFLTTKGLVPGDLARSVAIVEGLSQASGTVASIFMVNAVFGGAAIALMGTSSQKEEILPRLAAGRYQLAFALTEPEAGSDAASLITHAEQGHDGFRITGEKLYTTGAMTANHILVVARTAPITEQPRAFAVFLVPPDAKGVHIEPMNKLAGNAQPSCRVILDDVPVPERGLLGGMERLRSAWEPLRITGLLERLMVAGSCLGSAERIVEEATQFSRSRVQFGRPIAEFQSIRHQLVEMASHVHVMRLIVQEAIEALESGRNPTVPVCIAKYLCAETLQGLATQGMRIMGGRAYFTGNPMERIYREAPLSLYAGGTIEIQKDLIARAMGL